MSKLFTVFYNKFLKIYRTFRGIQNKTNPAAFLTKCLLTKISSYERKDAPTTIYTVLLRWRALFHELYKFWCVRTLF